MTINEFLQEYVDKFVAPTIPGTLGAAFAGQVQGWLKVKLTTLVEQARQEGREEVVNNFKIHLDVWKEKLSESMLVTTIEAILSDHARTISSDRK